ncbi:hypothetical protein [Caminibacter mediatlanticus]|uniref:Uncharacterized protein n=1 Tax=Caminibacter mediatlanticus TB-2 TaxID=391592 RepID=A0AAI9AJF4_9BACT|nr:hypothetical protein [Caminibacter mediatlanticus]EDM24607.1 hypothetical protein CMTB2_03788 [Caminibacter mediatlanticus TB-2]
MDKEKFFKKLAEKLEMDVNELKEIFKKLTKNSKEAMQELEEAIKNNNFEKIERLTKYIKQYLSILEDYSILFTEFKNDEDIKSVKVWESLKEKIFALTN